MDKARDSKGGRYQLTHEAAFINRLVGNLRQPRTLLDVCCGSGSVSLSIRHLDSLRVGLDIDLSLLVRFHEISRETLLSAGDVLHMPFANASIDCITAIHCFDHLNRVQFLQECHRVLPRGGLLIFEALNRNSYKWILKKSLYVTRKGASGRWREKWVNVWSCRDVLRAVDDCGFDVQAVYGYNWVPFPQGSNSRLIGPAAFVEHLLRLDRFFTISPRFLVAARPRDVSS